MFGHVMTLVLFLGIGIAWRFWSLGGISAENMKRAVSALTHEIFLPLAVFFVIFDLPLNDAALRILLYVLGTSALALAAAWLWLWKVNLGAKTKGALLIAAGFGGVFFLGMPMNLIFYPDWTMRVAVEYGVVANVLLLYTAGPVLSRSFGEAGKLQFGKSLGLLKDYKVWLKEPLFWASVLGLVLNMFDAHLPSWLNGIDTAISGTLIALLLLTVGLSLSWSPTWNTQIVSVLPAMAIQLILVPLLMWGMASLFGHPGVKTTLTLLLDSMLPATVLGFAFCERFKLDTGIYSLAFSLSAALSVLTIPAWSALIL